MSNNEKNKTFGDLFSNIDNKDNNTNSNSNTNITKEKKYNSFNSILKKGSINLSSEEKENEKNTKLEDKSSFNSILNNNKEKEDKNLNIFAEAVKEEIEEKNTEFNQEEKVEDTSNIFEEIPKEEIEENESIENKNDENSEKDINDILDQNPFFIEEATKEENNNPFFNNNINLIENNKHNKVEIDSTNTKIDTSNTKHFNVKIVKKKEPLIKLILGVISYALFIWLLLVGIVLLVYVADIKIKAARGDNSTPTYNAYVVLTGSMLPDIQVYDVVVTKKMEPKNLKEGDIITFASSDTRFAGTIITHRIIKKYYDAEKKEYTFQTKGDNNNVADSALVQSNNIFGKVVLKIPKLGYLQEFLASRGGWIIAILLPCLAVISYDIIKLTKGLRRKKYKNIKVQSR